MSPASGASIQRPSDSICSVPCTDLAVLFQDQLIEFLYRGQGDVRAVDNGRVTSVTHPEGGSKVTCRGTDAAVEHSIVVHQDLRDANDLLGDRALIAKYTWSRFAPQLAVLVGRAEETLTFRNGAG